MKNVLIGLVAAIGVCVGVAAFVYGGYDDSPGLQGLGVLLAIGILAWAARAVRRRGKPGNAAGSSHRPPAG